MKNVPVIDVTKISKEDQRLIAQAFLPLIQAYYAIPENQAAFEKSQAEKKAKLK